MDIHVKEKKNENKENYTININYIIQIMHDELDFDASRNRVGMGDMKRITLNSNKDCHKSKSSNQLSFFTDYRTNLAIKYENTVLPVHDKRLKNQWCHRSRFRPQLIYIQGNNIYFCRLDLDLDPIPFSNLKINGFWFLSNLIH